MFAVALAAYQLFMSSKWWHADLAIGQLDCSYPTVCRYPAQQNMQRSDANRRPFRFITNALGFRGTDLPIRRRDPSTLRIQIYGDSMVFGIGVDDAHTLPSTLRRILEQRMPGGEKVEVMNFGLPVTFLLTNLRSYAAFGRQYEPDIVIFASPRTQTHDLTWRVHQIQSSSLLTFLLATDSGRWLINAYQSMSPEWGSDGMTALRDAMRIVAADQRERDMRLYFFEFFTQVPAWLRPWFGDAVDQMKGSVFPPDLRFGQMSTGMTIDEYRASGWAIPGDGHPTPAGHEYFAGLLAERILADLAVYPLKRAVAVGARR